MEKIICVTIFLLTYFFVLLRRFNPLISIYLGVLALFIFGVTTFKDAFSFINYNVLGVFLGTIIVSQLFTYSGVPRFLAELLLKLARSVGVAYLLICGLTAFISSFTENVATILLVAPLALEITKRLGVNPVPLLIGMTVSANLEGCATMIGDSPSLILALESGMNFNDFFILGGRPSIFFAVQIGALFSFLFLYFKYRVFRQEVKPPELEPPKTWFPTFLLVGMVVSLALSSFIDNKPYFTVAYICLFWAGLGLIWYRFSHKEKISFREDIDTFDGAKPRPSGRGLKAPLSINPEQTSGFSPRYVEWVDWHTFFFLAGIFILVGSLSASGVLEDLARLIIRISSNSILLAYVIIIAISVFISAFVDNIPYTVAMIPVAKSVALSLGANPFLLLFGLLVGTCLGGNITPIGASCNIVTTGILRKENYKVSFREFVGLGLPFTLVAVVSAGWFIWIIFGGIK